MVEPTDPVGVLPETESPLAGTEPLPGVGPPRLRSLDAYRGFVMLAMASAGLSLAEVARQFPDSKVWKFLGAQFDHMPWSGCSFWDLIQPSFMFMVGVALPFSFASRLAKGSSYGKIFAHTLWRAAALILLGIFLSSNWSKQTDFTFVNVLTQIGLGYVFVFLLLGRGLAVQLALALLILAGYWLLFFVHPLPAPGFDPASVGVAAGFEQFTGLFAHWNKNANAASAFDLWFMNLFPRPEAFRFNGGGYQTLNFVPSMATMIFGLMAGEMLLGKRSREEKFLFLAGAGALCLPMGLILGSTACPIVKRIWTPSWTIYSAGWTFWMLAVFFGAIEILGTKRWAFPLIVVGMNSIAMYCMAQLMKPWVSSTLKIHLGQGIFDDAYGPIAQSVAVLLVLWLICLWMYRKKIFLRL